MGRAEETLREVVAATLGGAGLVTDASKLFSPSPGVVPRTALVERVRRQLGDIVTVTAPAGYGKSTFVAELVNDDPRPVAWVSLTSADNDPATLLTYVALALDRTENVDPSTVSALWVRSPTIGTAELQQFGAGLSSRRRAVVLVLDDVHELVSVDARDALATLVAAMPVESTVILSSRASIPLPLGRLRVRRRLVEVDAADLAFDPLDATILLDQMGLDVAADDVEHLVERTEGWPVAVYLAALAHRGRRTLGDGLAGRLTGDHRYLVDYLGEELMGRLDTDVGAFLMEASCLARLNGQLCDDVLQRAGSAALLEALCRQYLLVIPLDDRREWYRFHHLMSDFLRAELERRDPTRRSTIHRRASEWLDAHGDVDGAITHAVAAGDLERAGTLVLRGFGRMVASGRFVAIDRWLSLFSDDDLGRSPGLMVVAAHSRYAGGRPRAALHWLARADAAMPDRHPTASDAPVGALQVAIARATIAPMPPAEMAAEARYGYEHANYGEGYPLSCLIAGAAAFMLGDEAEAVLRLRESAESTLHRPTVEGTALAHLAMIDVEHGRWEQATVSSRRAMTLVGDVASAPSSVLIPAVKVLVETHAGRPDDVEGDRQLCRRNLGALEGVAPWLTLQARIALARAALLRGDRNEASTLITEADVVLTTVPGSVGVVGQLTTLRRIAATLELPSGLGAGTLTTAELRVLPLLPTHLSFAEIGERLYVSRHTVKSQALAIYRKLGATTRGGAVEIAVSAGLLGPTTPTAG